MSIIHTMRFIMMCKTDFSDKPGNVSGLSLITDNIEFFLISSSPQIGILSDSKTDEVCFVQNNLERIGFSFAALMLNFLPVSLAPCEES